MNEPTSLLLPFQIKPAYGLISNFVEPSGLGAGLGLGQGEGLQVPCVPWANSEDDANAQANRRKMNNLTFIFVDHLQLGLDHFTSAIEETYSAVQRHENYRLWSEQLPNETVRQGRNRNRSIQR
jgi:hypothetical protein